MKPEDAIRILRYVKPAKKYVGKLTEAIDMAIEALQAKTDEDTIRRQDAIDAANRTDYRGLTVEDVKNVTDEVVKELNRLPSAQPRCKDAVSRADVDILIEEAETARLKGDILLMYPALKKGLQKVPSVMPKQPRWIPVTERLPEDEQNVLVTYKTTDKIHPCQYHDDGSRNPWYSYIDQCRAHMNVVLAWMPLPEAWKGDKDGI